MIPKSQNITLLIVGSAASKNPKWVAYAHYCFNREKGLRADAFKCLDQFIKTAETWTLEEKIDFTRFLLDYFDACEDPDFDACPEPLSKNLLITALKSWCEIEKADSKPFRWYARYAGDIEYFFKAFKINPHDDNARQLLLKQWCFELYFSVHHLPNYYIGDLGFDIDLISKTQEQISLLSDAKQIEYWTNQLKEELELVTNYAAWQKSGHANFDQWGRENKKKVGYNVSYK